MQIPAYARMMTAGMIGNIAMRIMADSSPCCYALSAFIIVNANVTKVHRINYTIPCKFHKTFAL
jgi:hypothetical protein